MCDLLWLMCHILVVRSSSKDNLSKVRKCGIIEWSWTSRLLGNSVSGQEDCVACLSYRMSIYGKIELGVMNRGARDIARTVAFNSGLDITHGIVLSIARNHGTIVCYVNIAHYYVIVESWLG